MPVYKLIFRGVLSADLPAPEIRDRLLRLYGNKADVADRFFTGRTLVVRKDLDYPAAEKYRAMFERAGVPCDIVEDRPALSSAGTGQAAQKSTARKGPGLPASRSAAGTSSYSRTDTRPQRGVTPPLPRTAVKRNDSLLKGDTLQNTLAALMILMIVAGAGFRIWVINKARAIHPPDQVSATATEVCLHANGVIYFLAPDGRLTQRVPLRDIGLSREPADLQLLRNGDFLIGDLEKGEIRRCERKTLACRRIGPAGGYSIRENFKFLLDEGRNLLFISDTNNHALLVQGLDGSGIRKIDSKAAILYPNGLAEDGEGRLWLSNTAKEEVVPFEIADKAVTQADASVSLAPHSDELDKIKESMKQKPGEGRRSLKDIFARFRELQKVQEKLGDDLVQKRPLSIAWDAAGNLWVAASDGFVTTAGVRVFDPSGKQLGRIPLGKGAVPVDVAASGDRILIADSGLFQIFSVPPGSYAPAAFGDTAFRQELSKARDLLGRYRSLTTWSGRGIWLLAFATVLLVVFIAARNYGRRQQAAAAVREAARRSAPPAGVRPDETPPGVTRRYGLEFTGTGAEYFRIWIVNVFLTIVTLGIYGAWAKVRTRRYFYRNTLLGGHAFDYTADPLALLKGYGIVAAGLLGYYLVKYFNPMYGLLVLALFSLVIPLLVYKSLRFFTRNSTYRNIPFRFLGTLGESYRTYLFYPLLIVFTLGLIVPYWTFRKKKYLFDNVGYGTTTNSFTGTHGPFYRVYIVMAMAIILASVSFAFAAALLGPLLSAAAPSGGVPKAAGFLTILLLVYGVMLIVVSFFQMYIYAWSTNYCFVHSELGELRFDCTLSGWRLFWIRISNIAAIIFSIGLLTPWAKVRRMRYLADNLSVIAACDLGNFTAAAAPADAAYGDAATDFFDLEIGL